MTGKNHWLLPEGIDEVLPPQSWRLEKLRRSLFDLYRSWGYELIVPPLIEYLEPLLTGAGNDLDLQTFKLTDQLTGRLMGVRADITPQAARIDAHKLQREAPVRLCYLGTVLHTRSDGFAGSRSPMQLGAELFGHGGVESDAEILLLLLETLSITGVRDNLHIDLGHVGIFRALIQEAELDKANEALLFDALQRKALPEVQDIVASLSITEQQKTMLAGLAQLHGPIEELEIAQDALADGGALVQKALEDMKNISDSVRSKWPDLPLYYDLGELRGYHYHTGLLFAAFVGGVGQEIARGGRYDGVGKEFGRGRPATGFSANLKLLMQLGVEESEAPTGILAPARKDAALDKAVAALRRDGERVVYELPGQVGSGSEIGCERMMVYKDGMWQVVPGADQD